MKSMITSAAAVCLSAMLGVTSLTPVNAAPLPQAPQQKIDNSVELAAFRNHDGRWVGRRHVWRGHRGYNNYRHGYRRHSDGFWYPLAAFGAGAIIGGAIAAPARRTYVRNPHNRWCRNHYRTFRASDNTYQPYNGPRRQCLSPYN